MAPHLKRISDTEAEVVVGGIGYRARIIPDGGVAFGERDGVALGAFASRITFEYKAGLWYMADHAGFAAPLSHFVGMHTLLQRHVYADHEGGDHAPQRFRDNQPAPDGGGEER